MREALKLAMRKEMGGDSMRGTMLDLNFLGIEEIMALRSCETMRFGSFLFNRILYMQENGHRYVMIYFEHDSGVVSGCEPWAHGSL